VEALRRRKNAKNALMQDPFPVFVSAWRDLRSFAERAPALRLRTGGGSEHLEQPSRGVEENKRNHSIIRMNENETITRPAEWI
jgi:hypothetical protein